jgi:hypothetical protein
MELIQLNKFSHLHDGRNIIFCKTDYILQEFEYIKNLDNDVILITGNSDIPITELLSTNIPKNIKKWFGQNTLSFDDRIDPIPMGIENRIESIRSGHGIGYPERVIIKENLLSRQLNVIPTKKIYSNFQINTNFKHRSEIKNICINSNHIEWGDPELSLEVFFNKILDYEFVVCPAGNGVDTHRIWEVLYSKRIPITIKIGDFKIYDLYKKLPIIILDKNEDLYDFDLIQKKSNEIKLNLKNLELIDYRYWEKKILELKKI